MEDSCLVAHGDDPKAISNYGACISAVAAASVFVVRVCDVTTHGFPARVPTMASAVAFLFSMNLTIGTMVDYNQMDAMVSDYEQKYQSLCRFQGVVFQLTSLVCVQMVLFISFITFEIVVLRIQKRQIMNQESPFHACAWIVSAVLGLCPLLTTSALDVYSWQSGIQTCWLDVDRQLEFFYWFLSASVVRTSFMTFKITRRFYLLGEK
eukprot:FR735078.1.p1 GENE.FR735078.1~~FR735078.1.p1  ORF type:complete len:208 (+),score=35.65 FR735078.1:153-776(+)